MRSDEGGREGVGDRSSERKKNEEKNEKNGTGETFTLRPKMKIVLLDALMRGQRARHYIRVSERCASDTKTAVNSLFLDSHQCASSIIARLTARPIPASGSLSRISIHPDRPVNIACWEWLLADF